MSTAGNRRSVNTTSVPRTPFLIRYPGGAPLTQPLPVSSVDVAPTIAALAGVTPPATVDGTSLVPLLTGSPPGWRQGVLLHAVDDDYQSPGYWAVNTGGALYVELTTGERELYDMAGTVGTPDPWQLQNRIADPAYAGLRDQLAAMLVQLRDPAVVVDVAVGDGGAAPADPAGPSGMTVRWTSSGTIPHRVTDTSGLALFDSGAMAPGARFSATFPIAGAYPYAVDGVPVGTVSVSPTVGPTSGGTAETYLVKFGSVRPATGFAVDLQVQRPAATSFVDWKVGSTVSSATFVPDGGKGMLPVPRTAPPDVDRRHVGMVAGHHGHDHLTGAAG